MLRNTPELLATEGVQSLYKAFIELCFSSYDIYGIFLFLFKREKYRKKESIFIFQTQY